MFWPGFWDSLGLRHGTCLRVKSIRHIGWAATRVTSRGSRGRNHQPLTDRDANDPGTRRLVVDLSTASRLEVATALCSVLAVRLVQLNAGAVDDGGAERTGDTRRPRSAKTVAGNAAVAEEQADDHGAGLLLAPGGPGGFPKRKGDGEPGWITLWRGTIEFVQGIRDYLAMRNKMWATPRVRPRHTSRFEKSESLARESRSQ